MAMLKYLRIAVTALSLTACVLLIAFWVRSCWWQDVSLGGYSTYLYYFQSQLGGLEMSVFDPNDPEIEPLPVPTWRLVSNPINWPKKLELTDAPRVFSYLGIGWRFWPNGFYLSFPHWTLVAMSAALTAAPWIHWSKRFSLRTLLIATTLVAVGLGIIISTS